MKLKIYNSFVLSFVLVVSLVLGSFFLPTKKNANAATAPKVFLMGGAIADNNSEIYNALKTATGKTNPVVAVVCSAAADYATALDAYTNDIPGHLSYKNLFTSYGFTPVFIPVAVDNYTTEAYKQSNIDLINSADVIFFNGGDQSRHVRSLLKDDGTPTPLFSAIQQRASAGAIISGTSAGTSVQSPKTYGEGISYGYLYFNKLASKKISDVSLADSTHPDNGGYTTGFGFVNAAIDTHFDARGRIGRILLAERDLNLKVGYGIDENTALYLNGTTGKVYGERGVFVVDSTNAVYGTLSSFTANNVKVSYLTSGDIYNSSTKTVTSTKTLITTPYYTTIRDSSNIFGEYETTTTITRLVDTNVSYLYGDTYETGPQFTLKFIKDANTKGYYKNGKYTVSNVTINISY
ncbi:cyanophycinase [Gottfriedia solisilvae]|uniref:Cyanophycinase n=1 Tax=Gottfriedia solisilvae TaxID=1516104 RepID=A0A8J3ASW1_9BACI|nr:cyanophycinase [Gottfriedia solisilvae]GGI15573.1 hypothetical protein GCM10007380_28660 [Gottfriedia solisilvae]